MLEQIERYWTDRAPSYSRVVQYEMSHENEANWMRVITQQLEENHCTRVQAKLNAGIYADCIDFRRMDAQDLEQFEDGTFILL